MNAYLEGIGDNANSLSRYDAFLQNLGIEQNLVQLVHERLEYHSVCRILDIGCGDGGALFELKKAFQSRVHTIGIDLRPASFVLDEFIHANARDIPFPSKLSLILSFRALHEIGQIEKVLHKISQAMDSESLAILSIRSRTPVPHGFAPAGILSSRDLAFLDSLEDRSDFDSASLLSIPFLGSSPNQAKNPMTGFLLLLKKT